SPTTVMPAHTPRLSRRSPRMFVSLLMLLVANGPAPSPSAQIEAITAKHWQANHITAAPLADDATFIRRITLDLAGRVPTSREASAFVDDRSRDKREHVIRKLMASPEYALHLGRILDEVIQEKYAGKTEFLDYMRSAVAGHKSWDAIFREVMLGPWE